MKGVPRAFNPRKFMKELLIFLLKEITGKEFSVEEIEESGRISLQVKADSQDMGMIIGKGGRTIKAIQDILRVKGSLEEKSVFINVSEKQMNSF